MELELCLGYSREELDEAFRAIYDHPMEDVLDLFAQERLQQCPSELLDDFAGQVTMELHGRAVLRLLPLPLRRTAPSDDSPRAVL